MKPNSAISAADLELTLEPVPDSSARTAVHTLTEFGGLEIGVWEMTPGVMTDVEADEVFVVLSGAATVEFADGTAPLTLSPGDVVRLAAGTETVWTVTETLRKVYLAG
ncbi:cupin domain-containing protein [Mycolicibacterium sp. 120266]|uniref:cupin domain-containing protein n=1 Tax=Mycolicibacterium sp. 120266 TaxID=3090601 RepID=UPI00299F08E7|nr:cupin domain-containing protein [Mycolicibacterium sp. 120266]MDX1875705.1 cupin domain-containing protein [Mycolicibacterium sp. 120266]